MNLFCNYAVNITMEEIQIKIDEIVNRLKEIDPDTDEAVNLSGELDELSAKADALYIMQDY